MAVLAVWFSFVYLLTIPVSVDELADLNSKIVYDKNANPHDGISDINRVRISPKFLAIIKPRKDDVPFRVALVECLTKNDSDFGAYALLNELYPKHCLTIATGPFALDQDRRQLQFRYDGFVVWVELNRKTYQQIAREYWEVQLLAPKDDTRRIGNHRYREDEPLKSPEEIAKDFESLQGVEDEVENANMDK